MFLVILGYYEVLNTGLKDILGQGNVTVNFHIVNQ